MIQENTRENPPENAQRTVAGGLFRRLKKALSCVFGAFAGGDHVLNSMLRINVTTRDLIYVTAIVALFAVCQRERSKSRFTLEEQQMIEGIRALKNHAKKRQPGRPNGIDVNERLLEGGRSSA